MKFYPTKRGGGGSGKGFSHAKVGSSTTSFEVVFMCELDVLAILKGGQKVSTL